MKSIGPSPCRSLPFVGMGESQNDAQMHSGGVIWRPCSTANKTLKTLGRASTKTGTRRGETSTSVCCSEEVNPQQLGKYSIRGENMGTAGNRKDKCTRPTPRLLYNG